MSSPESGGIADFLKKNKSDHYNHLNTAEYKVSTGSLNWDTSIGGGFTAGVLRFCGASEAGKTSAAFEVARNFQKTHKKNARVLYLKAEGRLGEDIKIRTGLNFVTDPEEWDGDSCFVFKCNIFETIVQFIDHILNLYSGGDERLLVVLDSVDALIRKSDMGKDLACAQVAGVPWMMDRFLRNYTLKMSESGHLLILVSQVRATINIDKYNIDPQKQLSSSGGNATIHYPNWIFTFLKRNKSDNILRNPGVNTPDPESNPIIGHNVNIRIEKSTNDSTGYKVTYPVKHGIKGGSSVWTSKEVVDALLGFSLLQRAGAWYNFSEEAKRLMEALKKNAPSEEKFQGLPNVQNLFEENKKLASFWYKYVIERLEDF